MDVVASIHSRGHLSILQVNCEKINLDIALDDAQVQLTDRNFTNEKDILRNTSFMLIWCDGVMVGCDISGCRHTITAPPGCWLRDTGRDGATIMSWELRVMECEVTTTSAR